MPTEQPSTGVPGSGELTIMGNTPAEASCDAHGREQHLAAIAKIVSSGKLHTLVTQVPRAALSLVPLMLEDDPSHPNSQVLLHEIYEGYKQRMRRLVGITPLPREVTEENIEQFRSIIVIILGKRLGGLLGRTATQEGESRCEAAAEHIPVLHALAPKTTLIAGASGHREEGGVFTEYLKKLLNKRQFNTALVEFFTERCAQNTFENILFSRAEIIRLLSPLPPRLWILSSSDNHLGSLLLKNRTLPSKVTELGLLQQDEGDAVAFLSAPYPYRSSGDKGLEWICQTIDTAFLAAPIQANLYGIKDGVPEVAEWGNEEKEWGGKKEGRIRLDQVYEGPVRCLHLLIEQLKYLIDPDVGPLTEYEPETQCAFLVKEVRENIISVLGPLTKIHQQVDRVKGLKNGSSFEYWHGVNLDKALKGITKFVARVRWFADTEASDADREKVRQQY